jgi:hypothetical protein
MESNAVVRGFLARPKPLPPRHLVATRLSDDEIQLLRHVALERRCSLTQLLTELMRDYLEYVRRSAASRDQESR